MQGKLKLFFAGLATFLAFIIFAFPANMAYRWIAPPQLRLSGIGGSLWHGSASEGSIGGFYIRNIRWKFQPLSLLTAKLAFQTSASPGAGSLDGHVAVGPTGAVILSDVTGRLSISDFQDFYQLRGFEGQVDMRFERLKIADGIPVDATGTVSVENLLSRQLSAEPIGNYVAVFSTNDNAVSAAVEDQSGVLDLTGTISINEDRSYSFIGQVAASPRAPAGLRNQLQYLGSPDASGRREFRIEGQL